MSGIYLLDTSAAIGRINQDQAVIQLLEQADQIFLSVVVLGELYFGAEHSGRIQANLDAIERFALECTLTVCDSATARIYGSISQQLRAKGRPIPQNDIWIAALAIQHDLTLLTRDAHFAEVAGLAVQNW